MDSLQKQVKKNTSFFRYPNYRFNCCCDGRRDLKMTQTAGMVEHLSKPIDIDKFKEVIDNYLETYLEKSRK